MIVKDLSNSYNPCPKSPNRQKKSRTRQKIKQKSNKLLKLERERDKDIIKSGKCDYCGRICSRLDPHEVYGGRNRKRSIENNFIKMLCRQCHSNEEIIKQLRIDVQKEYEKEHTREEFIKIIGKSYIDSEG